MKIDNALTFLVGPFSGVKGRKFGQDLGGMLKIF
jgi:hypothetical protein